ncbi:MAG: RNA pyrophosphohydrolase [Rhodospirillales bacterium]|nr:RNA pyrophosphohydrolase [Rhodospirillales bacterium]MDP6882785.1 RNA pyrophosphohydrolase [Rhodospirillales bacterium]
MAKKAEVRPYRRGVGAMVLNHRGEVFVGRRIDTPGEAWQMPQGGIDAGEAPRLAVKRELAEETGIETARIVAESAGWLRYDLPRDLSARVWKGRYRGQEQKWFALRFTGIDGDIDLNASRHPEFSQWKWVAIDRLPDLIVAFKRRLYEDVVAEFRHLAKPRHIDYS